MKPRVLVINHMATGRGMPGHTRHVDLFSELTDGLDVTIVGANRNLQTRGRMPKRSGLVRTVWTVPYQGNDARRILNWLSFAAGVVLMGLRGPRPHAVIGSSPTLFAGLAALVIARLRRAAFVLEVRDLWPQVLLDMGSLDESSSTYRILRAIEELLYRQADLVIVLAEGVREELAARGVDPDRIALVPNGADPLPEPEGTLASRRARFDLAANEFIVAYAGAHGPANGLDLVLDAAAKLQDTVPDARILLVGDGVEKPRLVERARDERLDNVTFMDAIPKAEMPELLGSVDVGLHTLADVDLFRYGVSPNKILDYMAAGLPVITNTGGETAGLVEHADAGIGAAPQGIADAIVSMHAADLTQRRRWGSSGRVYLGRHRSLGVLATSLRAAIVRALRHRQQALR